MSEKAAKSTCPSCGAQRREADESCKKCGHSFSSGESGTGRIWWIVGAALVVVIAAAVTLVLVLGGGGGEEVGRVGDVTYDLSDIEELYLTDSVAIDETFRQTLFQLLAIEALEQAASAEFGIEVGEEQVDTYYNTRLVPLLEENNVTAAELLNLPNASNEMLRFNARVLVLRDAVAAELMREPAFVAFIFGDPAQITTVCTRHILVETEDEAQTVLDRLAAGEEFDPVAREVSIDTGSAERGGSLGCASPAGFVESFAEATMTATIDEVTGPVESQFGFHLIIVDDRRVPTQEQYLADPGAYVSSEDQTALWGEWFNDALEVADVEVAERFGTWTDLGIEPPG
jgi:hypothetical protein